MRLLKSISLLILILFIAALFVQGTVNYQSVMTVFTQNISSFIQIGVIFLICMAISPSLGMLFCFRGRIWKGIFYALAAVAAAGGAILAVFPLKLAIGDDAAVVIPVCVSALVLSAMFLTDKTLQHKETVDRLSERGVKQATIRRSTAIKTAYALFFENTGRIMTVITAMLIIGDIVASGSGIGSFCLQGGNLLPAFILILSLIAVAALAGNLIGQWIEH